MKFSVSTYSFAQLVKDGFTQFDAIKSAKEMGFDGVELVWDDCFADGKPEEYAKKIAEAVAENDLELSNFTFGASFSENPEEEAKRVKDMIKIAKLAGAKSVRHDALWSLGKYRSFGAALPDIAKAIKDVSEFAAELGIFTMVENHGYILNSPDRMEDLYNAVDCDNFGLLADMGNFLCLDCDPGYAVGTIAPYTRYVHAKDFIVKNADALDPGEGFFKSRSGKYLRGTIVGQGDVPVAAVLGALKHVNYDGYIAVEFEGMENAKDAIRIGFENLKNYVLK